jgi:hypothetical protein
VNGERTAPQRTNALRHASGSTNNAGAQLAITVFESGEFYRLLSIANARRKIAHAPAQG